MPNIHEYVSPNLDLNPGERGASAWDSSASRVGRFYGDAAQSQRQKGSLAAQAAKQKMWPFDILALYERRAAAEAGRGGVNFRVRGGVGDGFRGSSTNFADFGESRNTGAPYAAFGQVSRGAAALGEMLSDGGHTAGSMTGSNTAGGLKLMLGGGGGAGGGAGGGQSKWALMNEALAYAQKITATGPDMVSYQGEWIKASDESKINATERAGAAEALRGYQDRAIGVQDYWSSYYGRGQPGGGYNPYTNQPMDSTTVSGPIPPPIPDAYDDRYFGGVRDWITGN